MHLDLHLHSTCSDGTVAPGALPDAARRGGLHAFALTDHDTTAGVSAALETARAFGVLVIAGTELTCDLDGREVHLLGYGIDPADGGLARLAARRAAARRQRLAAIVERLQQLGVGVGIEDVVVPPGNAAPGRPHVAEALVRRGAARTIQDAFSRYLADGAPAYVPPGGTPVADAIAAVAAAGGCSVWAHPSLEDVPRFARLRDAGLEGVETLRPGVAPTVSLALEQGARECGLVVSGGSDWHGGPSALGTWFVTERHVRGLLDRLGVAVG